MNTLSATRAFLRFSFVILTLSSALKFVSASMELPISKTEDPVLHITVRQVLISAGMLELVLACYLAWGKCIGRKLLSIGWLSTLLVIYRLILWISGSEKPCSCLGNLSAWIGTTEETASTISLGILAALFSGSVTLLIYNGRPAESAAANPNSVSIKSQC